MKNPITKIIGTLGCLFLTSACVPEYQLPSDQSFAYEPVYVNLEEARNITFEEPRELGDPGKIYYKGGILFVVEWFKGIHVFDDSDPSNPVPLKFIKISGVTDVAISGSTMYANNLQDLVSIDLSNPLEPTIAHTNKNVFQTSELEHPPQSNTYFECVDPFKGQVVAWALVPYESQKCFR